MTVSERIREQMTLLDLSYGELSAKTGLTKSAIHRYATGHTDKIPTEALEKLARALHVTPAFLTGWEQSEPTTLAAHLS
jgi:repressor LexA